PDDGTHEVNVLAFLGKGSFEPGEPCHPLRQESTHLAGCVASRAVSSVMDRSFDAVAARVLSLPSSQGTGPGHDGIALIHELVGVPRRHTLETMVRSVELSFVEVYVAERCVQV